eukprot:TRINITY_DN5408_c0_g1_i5.p1 TRINITY_DN5408_c0_g1~~TRINITY_DN5408_c0_g1_i5.p1  ORF type:complete len:1020 (+),score=181.07 TRINITY_DN5408_c0_g1_i5:114-3173(+)
MLTTDRSDSLQKVTFALLPSLKTLCDLTLSIPISFCNMSASRDNLESKKRFVKMAFDSKQAYQAEAKVKDFESALNAARPTLDASYLSESEAYLGCLRRDLSLLKIDEEYTSKMQSWRSQLRRTESSCDNYEPGRGCNAESDYRRILGEINAMLSKPELQASKEVKQFTHEWTTTLKPHMDRKIADLNIKMEWSEQSSSLQGWIRPLERDIANLVASSRDPRGGADQLQKTTESARDALDKLDKSRWGAYEPAQTLITKISDLVAKAYDAMGDADAAKTKSSEAKASRDDRDIDDKLSAAPAAVAEAIRAGKCSYSVTKDNFKRQPYFSCNTCGDGYGLCIACRRSGCHPHDHTYSELKMEDFYCDCGHSGKCKCIYGPPPSSSTPSSTPSSSSTSPSATGPVCKSKHAMAPSSRSCNCDGCGKSATSAATCHTCDYDLCGACVKKATPPSSSSSSSASSASALPSPSPSPASSTFEVWVPGNASTDQPAGRFDTSNRQCKLALRDALDRWNSRAIYFNNAWREVTKMEKELEEEKGDNLEWAKNNLDRYLSDAEDVTSSYRSVQDDIISVTGKDHPAVRHVEDELRAHIKLVRDHRDKADKILNQKTFERTVHDLMQMAQEVYKEGYESRDNLHASVYISGEPYQSLDTVFVFVLKTLNDVKSKLAEAGATASSAAAADVAGRFYPIRDEVAKLEALAKAAHEEVCVRWATQITESGRELEEAQKYRNALQSVLGDAPCVQRLDAKMKGITEEKKKQKESQAASNKLAQEKFDKDYAAERAKMTSSWLTPYAAGGKVYCEGEVWSYDGKDGNAKCEGSDGEYRWFSWDGINLKGPHGSGVWNEKTLVYSSSRPIYIYAFDGKIFTPQDKHDELPSFKWDGNVLLPSGGKDSSKWSSRVVRFDGKVPVTILLAIALRPWADDRAIELTGTKLCRAGLHHEGVQAKTCDKCSTNSRLACCVCRDPMAFARNPALQCKYCEGRCSAACVKCGGSFAYTPAFLCDVCHYSFNGNCIRQTQHY